MYIKILQCWVNISDFLQHSLNITSYFKSQAGFFFHSNPSVSIVRLKKNMLGSQAPPHSYNNPRIGARNVLAITINESDHLRAWKKGKIIEGKGYILTLNRTKSKQAFISCQIYCGGQVLMPWNIIFDFSTDWTFNGLKSGKLAPDCWSFPEKFNNHCESASVGKSNVEPETRQLQGIRYLFPHLLKLLKRRRWL